MSEPVIISSYTPGLHAADLDKTISRLDAEASWSDLSTVIVTPASGTIPTRVVASWLGMIKPPNNKSVHLWAVGTEVGEAYTRMIEAILAHPELSTWKYVLCVEHDNLIPPDGMIKLLQRMEAHPEFAAIGGLYFTKGHGGVAQIWGDPHDYTRGSINFRPQRPDPNGGLVECNGTGQGFTMFRLSMFRDEKLRRPWFKTLNGSEGQGVGTQDLYAWSDFRKHGYRCAVDCSVRVGHWDQATETAW